MKQIVPAHEGIWIRSCGCTDETPYCGHNETFDQTVIAWVVYTEEDAMAKGDDSIYVEAVTTLDAMQYIQNTSGTKSQILIKGFKADLHLLNGGIVS
jgi:hypothetical protein